MKRKAPAMRGVGAAGLPLAAALLLAGAGCGPDKPTGDNGDDGWVPVERDAGPADAGPLPDDAGTPPDAGPDADGGTAQQLVVQSATPPRGPRGGGTIVVLYGVGFVDGFAEIGGAQASSKTSVTFGGNAVIDPMVIDDNRIEVRSPPGDRGAADIVVTNPNGSATCVECFHYFETVTVAGISPAQGSTLGGEPVTVTGGGFVPGVLVLVGGAAATDLSVSPDGKSLTAKTPPGAAGGADVTVVGPNSAAYLRRAFVYVAPMKLELVDPPTGPVTGGTAVVLRGSGFTTDATVKFGGQAATSVSFLTETQLTATVPPGAAVGRVSVEVTGRRSQAALADAFAYFDPASRELTLTGVWPRTGPTTGGTCAAGTGCLLLTGTGLSAPGAAVRVGTGLAAVAQVLDDHRLKVDLPPGGPGVVSVQLRNDRGGASLPDAFAYLAPLVVDSADPASGPASGAPATTVTLSGAGFSTECEVFLGAAQATVVTASPDGTSLVVTAPVGSPGARDVRVSCGDPASATYREAVLAGGFVFTAPLQLLQLDPDTGAIAGGTAVDLLGSGFTPGMTVLFGAAPATDIVVKSPHLATVRTPRGRTGMVDVTVRRLLEQDTLHAGFGYVDPTNILGGGSGGPMRGTLNVTVVNSTPGMGGPVEGATVSVNNDQLKGLTDDRGQVTFSDPILLKPVTITASKDKFAPTTIARIDARNVTLLMQMNEGDGEPSTPPPPPPAAVFRGRVCGFKRPTNLQLHAGQTLEARVWATPPYVYAAPPFRYPADPVVVSADCGEYALSPNRFGAMAIWAEYGIADSSGVVATWTPLLMGIRRGQEASPGKVVQGLDIVLDMHRDLNVPVSIEPAEVPLGKTVANLVYSYLDLGGDGVIPLGELVTADLQFVFGNHPREGGDGLIFLNVATVLDDTGQSGPPYSFFYRRQYGDPAAGVTIGPMMAFTRLHTPPDGGSFSGSLGWDFWDGALPDVMQIYVEEPVGLGTRPIWDIVLPGTEQAVSLPPSALSRVPSGTVLFWTVMTAKSPRFDFDRFGYQQLSVLAWTAFTQDWAVFTTP